MDRVSRRRQVGTQLFLVLVAFYVIAPIWILVILATDGSIITRPDSFRLVPADPTLRIFLDAWTRPARGLDFLGLLRNSLFVSGLASGIALVLGASMAYAFARLRFPGSSTALIATLVGSFLPLISLATPLFVLFLVLETAVPALRGFRGSDLALAILYAAFAMPLCVWLMRSAFRAVPVEMEEAAFVDGASRLTAFRLITLPIAAPSILVAALVAFLLAYSEFAIAWLFASREDNETLAMVLAVGRIGGFDQEWGVTAAHALLMTIPVVVVFVGLRRALLRGSLAGTAAD